MADHDGFSFAFSEQFVFVSSTYFAVQFLVSDVPSVFPPFRVYVLHIIRPFHTHPLLEDGNERRDLVYDFLSAFLWVIILLHEYLSPFAS